MRAVKRAAGLSRVLLLSGTVVIALSVGAHDLGEQEATECTGQTKQMKTTDKGAVKGKVRRGPLTPGPVEGVPGMSDDQLVPGVKIQISNLDGDEVESTETDDRGEYKVCLSPGTYRVEMPELAPGEFTKDLPAKVTIKKGKDHRLDIRIDTGIR